MTGWLSVRQLEQDQLMAELLDGLLNEVKLIRYVSLDKPLACPELITLFVRCG